MAKTKWPPKNRKELDAMIKYLETVEGSLGLSENPTPLEIFRYRLCEQLIIHINTRHITQREFAQELGLDEPEMSRILHHRIDKVSTDKLAGLVMKINPNIKLSVG